MIKLLNILETGGKNQFPCHMYLNGCGSFNENNSSSILHASTEILFILSRVISGVAIMIVSKFICLTV